MTFPFLTSYFILQMQFPPFCQTVLFGPFPCHAMVRIRRGALRTSRCLQRALKVLLEHATQTQDIISKPLLREGEAGRSSLLGCWAAAGGRSREQEVHCAFPEGREQSSRGGGFEAHFSGGSCRLFQPCLKGSKATLCSSVITTKTFYQRNHWLNGRRR